MQGEREERLKVNMAAESLQLRLSELSRRQSCCCEMRREMRSPSQEDYGNGLSEEPCRPTQTGELLMEPWPL